MIHLKSIVSMHFFSIRSSRLHLIQYTPVWLIVIGGHFSCCDPFLSFETSISLKFFFIMGSCDFYQTFFSETKETLPTNLLVAFTKLYSYHPKRVYFKPSKFICFFFIWKSGTVNCVHDGV